MCISYGHSLDIADAVGQHYLEYLTEAVINGRRFRLVGDNVNWATGVHNERVGRHGKMTHAFGSIAVIHDINCNDVSDPTAYLMRAEDWAYLKDLFVY